MGANPADYAVDVGDQKGPCYPGGEASGSAGGVVRVRQRDLPPGFDPNNDRAHYIIGATIVRRVSQYVYEHTAAAKKDRLVATASGILASAMLFFASLDVPGETNPNLAFKSTVALATGFCIGELVRFVRKTAGGCILEGRVDTDTIRAVGSTIDLVTSSKEGGTRCHTGDSEVQPS